MRISTKIESIDKDIDFFVNTNLSKEAQSKAFATFAQEQIDEINAQNARVLGSDPIYTQTVDGKKGAPLSSVQPTSVIVVEWELVTAALQWIEDQLVKHSPFLTGQYIRSHTLFADGTEVPFGVTVPVAEEYVFLSSVPYARKIERGLASKAPDGVYQVVSVLARRRFSNQVRISFSYRSFPGGAVGEWAKQTKLGSHIRNMARRGDWLVRQPAIIVRLG